MITETEGIILKQTKTLNGRRMILLFSEKLGKISAGTGMNEKGKGKTGLALRPFTYGRYELFKKRDNYYLNGAETLKSYYKISEDLDKYMNSSYVLELTEKLLTEDQPSKGIFQLLLDFFSVMENRKKAYSTLVLAYQVKTLNVMGVMPGLDVCLLCNSKKLGSPVYFSIRDGGLLCNQCGNKEEIHEKDLLLYPVDFGIVDILKYFYNCPFKDFEHLFLEEGRQTLLQAIIKKYMAYYLDLSTLKSEEFLKDDE